MTDPIADLLARVMNAVRVKHQEVIVPHSKLKESILEILRDQGYIKNFRVIEENNKKDIIVHLKYTEEGESVIRGAERVSKPGRRIYVKSKNLDIVLGGLGTGIVSTSSGIKTVKQCKKEKVGGEYLLKIW
ncbi:MAG: 30S ribosomal protein S8 [Deferribacterales bacterium]